MRSDPRLPVDRPHRLLGCVVVVPVLRVALVVFENPPAEPAPLGWWPPPPAPVAPRVPSTPPPPKPRRSADRRTCPRAGRRQTIHSGTVQASRRTSVRPDHPGPPPARHVGRAVAIAAAVQAAWGPPPPPPRPPYPTEPWSTAPPPDRGIPGRWGGRWAAPAPRDGGVRAPESP